MLLFVTAGIGKVSLKDLIRETAPYIVAEIIALFVITYVPETVMAMTRLMK
jgi:TRAP-type C4-dicarboxylate transport system permease large subunit